MSKNKYFFGNFQTFVFTFTLKDESLHCLETLGTKYPVTQRHTPEEPKPHPPRCKYLKNCTTTVGAYSFLLQVLALRLTFYLEKSCIRSAGKG
jgi:hypothetical protein